MLISSCFLMVVYLVVLLYGSTVPTSVVQSLITQAKQQHQLHVAHKKLFTYELNYYRTLQQTEYDAVVKVLKSHDAVLKRFSVQSNGMYM